MYNNMRRLILEVEGTCECKKRGKSCIDNECPNYKFEVECNDYNCSFGDDKEKKMCNNRNLHQLSIDNESDNPKAELKDGKMVAVKSIKKYVSFSFLLLISHVNCCR